MSCSSTAASLLGPPAPNVEYEIVYSQYEGEHQLPQITALIEKELSEPYIIYTYRYFLIEWWVLAGDGKQRRLGLMFDRVS